MNYFQTKFKKDKRWICPHCKRINGHEDQRCSFCREAKPEKTSSGEKNRLQNNAKGTEYGGRWYQSKLEANYAQKLDFLKKAKEIQDWTPQVKLVFKVNGVLICNHYVDFKVITKTGTVQYHETKGYETETYRLKKKLLLALLPEIDPGAEYIVIK